jgi:hypothetical protein
MAANYPNSVPSFTTKLDGPGNTIFASYVNQPQDEIVAIGDALLNGLAHGLKPTAAGGQDLGTSSLPWGIVRTRGLHLAATTTLTIASGVVTVTRSNHAVDTEGAAASDDLDTLTAGTGVAEGFIATFQAANVARVVTFKDGTGNLLLNGDCALSATDRTITLKYDGTNWREIARSVPAVANSLTLLYANSSTDTNASAANVDSIAISGLTAKDRLIVEVTWEQVTQAVARIDLVSSTDSNTVISRLSLGGSVASGATVVATVTISQAQSANTKYASFVSGASTGGGISEAANVSLTTAWTGSWTLALRHGGITAGGTGKFTWSVHRKAGQ